MLFKYPYIKTCCTSFWIRIKIEILSIILLFFNIAYKKKKKINNFNDAIGAIRKIALLMKISSTTISLKVEFMGQRGDIISHCQGY